MIRENTKKWMITVELVISADSYDEAYSKAENAVIQDCERYFIISEPKESVEVMQNGRD